MKKIILIVAVTAFVLLTLAPAVGETTSTVKAKIDFAFWVGTQQFQPGEYIFKTTDSNKHFLTIVNQSNKKQFAMTQDLPLLEPAKTDKLIFKRDGDKYVLHQIMVAGDSHGHDIGHAEVAVDIH
jgi:hypothetical protein